MPVLTILGSAVSNPGFEICSLSSVNEYGCLSLGIALYTTPRVSSLTSDPSIITGLYTGVPCVCSTGKSPLFLIIN